MSTGRVILDGAQLIDGSGGEVVPDSQIVIEGGQIIYSGPKTIHFDALQAERLMLSGKTVIPGLIEAHTHASFDADMRAYIKNGVTTIRFAGLDQTTVSELSRRISSGQLQGPRILSCGPMIDEPPPAYPEWSIAINTPAEAARVAERLLTEHDLQALIVTQRVTKPVMQAVIEVAHRHQRSVVGQTWEVDGKEAAQLGIDELHTSSRVFASKIYPRERLLNYGSIAERLALGSRAWASIDWEATRPIMEAMVERSVAYCGMQVITQFQIGEGVAELEADADFEGLFGDAEKSTFQAFSQRLQGSWSQDDVEYGRSANQKRMEWMQRFRELGGVLLAGTDMQFGGIMIHRELRNLEAIGMSRLEVITAATGDCARALHLDTKLGMVRKSLQADLVVLKSDPLRDLAALRDISCVIKNGKVVWPD